MRKSRIIIIACSSLLVVFMVGLIFNIVSTQNKEGLTQASISTASVALDAMHNKTDIASLISSFGKYISPEGLKAVADYENKLKAKIDSYIDLDALYSKKYSKLYVDTEKFGSPPIVGEKPATVITPPSKVTETFDKNIELVDGKKEIPVSKLIFNKDGKAFVLYKSIFLEFNRGEIPETYSMMLNNPVYSYKYSSNLAGVDGTQKYVDVLFESSYDGNQKKIVRVFNNGKKVTGFEVK